MYIILGTFFLYAATLPFLLFLSKKIPEKMYADFAEEASGYFKLNLSNESVTWLSKIHRENINLSLADCYLLRIPLSMTLRIVLLAGFLFGFSFLGYCLLSEPQWWVFSVSLVFCVLMISIDFDEMLLPDELVYLLMFTGLGASIFGVFISPAEAIKGVILTYLAVYGFVLAFKAARGIDGMGQGDIKLLAACGAFIGVEQILPLILLSTALSIITMGIEKVIVFRGQDMPSRPFGPHIIISFACLLLYVNAS